MSISSKIGNKEEIKACKTSIQRKKHNLLTSIKSAEKQKRTEVAIKPQELKDCSREKKAHEYFRHRKI